MQPMLGVGLPVNPDGQVQVARWLTTRHSAFGPHAALPSHGSRKNKKTNSLSVVQNQRAPPEHYVQNKSRLCS